jgi:hypothetical protein
MVNHKASLTLQDYEKSRESDKKAHRSRQRIIG